MADNMKTMRVGLGLDPQSARPSNAKDGDIYYSDGTGADPKGLLQYRDAAWVLLDASPETNWTSFTPTGSLTTNVTYTGSWKQINSEEREYQVLMSFTGTNTEGVVTINLPAGHVIDNTAPRLLLASLSTSVGTSDLQDTSFATFKGRVGIEDTTTVRVQFLENSGNGELAGSVNTATGNPFTIDNGDLFYVRFKLPIL